MKCAKEDLLLYAVTDRHWLNGRTLYEVVKESLDGGVTFLQLREKTLDKAHFLEEAKELQKLCKEYKVPFSMHVSGFKYREIAEKLDLPLGTVKSRIFFTRQRLQQELKDFV